MKRKKIRTLLAVLFICAALCMACKENDDSPQAESTQLQPIQSEPIQSESAQSEPIQSESEQPESIQPEPEQSDPAEDQLLAEQKEWYAFYIKELDRMLSVSREQERNNDIYQETIGSLYLFSQSYSGGLWADYNEDGTNAFQIVIMDDTTEERQRYECRLLQDGSLWFTYQTESKSEKDLPDYIVNEDVLRYGRPDYVYDDGWTDLEEEKSAAGRVWNSI